MRSFYTKLSMDILENQGYKDATSMLFDAYVKKIIGDNYSIDTDIIRKLTTSVQYFYQSDDDSIIKEGAELLSMLLDVASDKCSELVVIAENIFNEAGDFPNIELLQKKYPDNIFKVSLFDETRKYFRKSLNTVKEIDHTLTDYQRNLWEHLISGEDIITSAPTSTGKTHIILKYLVEQLVKNSEAFVAIVVPTRALISEVAAKVYDIAKEMQCEATIEICTFPMERVYKDKTVFVMTQERLSEILQTNILTFNYLFVDEAHYISDKSRGVLLHMTLQKLLEDSTPQIIISMPSQKYLNAFNSVFGDTEFITRKTKHSPVAKLFIETNFKGRNIILKKRNSDASITISKGFQGSELADIVCKLGKNESNIVYCNRKDVCENVADKIAKRIHHVKQDSRLEEAADYISKFIHKDFTLAENLKKGVAFHYGPLPSIVRWMVESLARDNLIDFIVCTSTLAEGINLPAKNLFLKNPMQPRRYKKPERLEDVKLDNITGRAGRMLEHFAGNIFLVGLDNWEFKDYFEINEDKEDKISTYYQVLNDDVVSIVNLLKGEYESDRENIYTDYSIANKLLREYESGTISATFSARELKLTEKEKTALLKAVQNAYKELKIPPFTLEANPTVGYLQQNDLHSFLGAQQNLSDWALPHPMSPNLYDQLIKICSKLFEFRIFLPHYNSIGFICIIAKKWIQGRPLNAIISEQMNKNPDKSCNRNVRDVIQTINDDIHFKMASALRCYQLIFTDVVQQKGLDIKSVKLHGFIEAGGCSDRLIQLINFGLSRETAIEIHSILKIDIEITSFEQLRSLYKGGMLNAMHPITKKEIEKLLL